MTKAEWKRLKKAAKSMTLLRARYRCGMDLFESRNISRGQLLARIITAESIWGISVEEIRVALARLACASKRARRQAYNAVQGFRPRNAQQRRKMVRLRKKEMADI